MKRSLALCFKLENEEEEEEERNGSVRENEEFTILCDADIRLLS